MYDLGQSQDNQGIQHVSALVGECAAPISLILAHPKCLQVVLTICSRLRPNLGTE